ncbi:hypothetical protein IPC1580_28225 [Pseudomonas aeruginosa]|nr:hypothetical protein IPC1580_28225 [Pseudomonas aeruginosa]
MQRSVLKRYAPDMLVSPKQVSKSCRTAIAIATLLIAASAVASPQLIEITHERGVISVPHDPRTTLVFDPGALDTLDSVDVDIQGVGQDHWTGALAKYSSSRYLNIGTLFEPDYETVFASDPSLIIVADRSAAKYSQLAKIAPTLDFTVDPKNLIQEVESNARKLGQIYDREGAIESEISSLNRAIANLRQIAEPQGKALVVLTSGGRLSAYGPGSRFGVIHDSFGFKAAAPDLKISLHGQVISYEFISKVDPDWLFVIDRDAAIGAEGIAAKALLDNPLVRNTQAWKNNHVVYLDGSDWYLVGLTGLGALQRSVASLTQQVLSRSTN